jgi:hypothetical protein
VSVRTGAGPAGRTEFRAEVKPGTVGQIYVRHEQIRRAVPRRRLCPADSMTRIELPIVGGGRQFNPVARRGVVFER